MATNQELLDAVAAGKTAVLGAVETEKQEAVAALGVLQTRITELEAIIAAGGDTQPAIDAVNAAFAEVKAGVEGIHTTTPPVEPPVEPSQGRRRYQSAPALTAGLFLKG